MISSFSFSLKCVHDFVVEEEKRTDCFGLDMVFFSCFMAQVAAQFLVVSKDQCFYFFFPSSFHNLNNMIICQ